MILTLRPNKPGWYIRYWNKYPKGFDEAMVTFVYFTEEKIANRTWVNENLFVFKGPIYVEDLWDRQNLLDIEYCVCDNPQMFIVNTENGDHVVCYKENCGNEGPIHPATMAAIAGWNDMIREKKIISRKKGNNNG
jgi:hypothetical protein